MTKLEVEIAQLLRQYQAKTGRLLTIGTAESATGGRISDKITNIPGSSDYYKGSIIAYSNEAKINILGVKRKTIQNYGAVSPQTAIEMAQGGRKVLQVDICISDTGIAGPSGATPEKPVGLFYLGLSAADQTLTRENRFQTSREGNKQKAAEAALSLLKEYLIDLLVKGAQKVEEKHIVTCFLEHNNKILILRRSQKVGTYQGQWAGVSGYVETTDDEQAVIEIKEEIGLDKEDILLLKKGEPLEIIDEAINRKWVVHPFLFHIEEPEKIKINWEHVEVKWIKPSEITLFKTVPGLKETLDRVIRDCLFSHPHPPSPLRGEE